MKTLMERMNIKSNMVKKSMAIFLIITCPPMAMIMSHTAINLNGSFLTLINEIIHYGLFVLIWDIWGPVFFGTQTAWIIIGLFAAVQLVFMKLLPGKRFEGPVTPMGNIPVYKANGIPAYLITMSLFCCLSFGLQLFSPSIIYNNFIGILGALNFTSLIFCLLLYLKGRFLPSSSDSSYTGNYIFDYYWGTELYPRIFGWDVKMFTNCRFGMMAWPLILVSFASAQHDLYGINDAMIVSVAIQLVYITKFFVWETGYLKSMDIQVDRAGFYICWGCLVWVPAVYTSPTLYLVNNSHKLGYPLAILILFLGVASVIVNYLADRQRQVVRETNGECLVWGKKPKLIYAKYTNEKNEAKQSILLASGYWGISRHFHYIPEILGAFFWSVPALFNNFYPYFYVSFLTILLIHRSYRDDRKCRLKYMEYWDEYCKIVPNKIIPKF